MAMLVADANAASKTARFCKFITKFIILERCLGIIPMAIVKLFAKDVILQNTASPDQELAGNIWVMKTLVICAAVVTAVELKFDTFFGFIILVGSRWVWAQYVVIISQEQKSPQTTWSPLIALRADALVSFLHLAGRSSDHSTKLDKSASALKSINLQTDFKFIWITLQAKNVSKPLMKPRNLPSTQLKTGQRKNFSVKNFDSNTLRAAFAKTLRAAKF
jgi:hypothetical protein